MKELCIFNTTTKPDEEPQSPEFTVIGVVVGSLLATISAILLDIYNKSKKLYVEVSKVGFHPPAPELSHLNIEGHFWVYIYNGSSFPQTYLLESFAIQNNKVAFGVLLKGEQKQAYETVHQIAPNSGLKLSFEVGVSAFDDLVKEDVNNKTGILTYKNGKRTLRIEVTLYFYDPEDYL